MSQTTTNRPEPVTDDDGLIGVNPAADLSVDPEKRDRGLKYVSKSRVKTYKTCPRTFWFKYWAEHRPPSNYHLDKGSAIHECFERFHENLLEYIDEHGEKPDRFHDLMPDDHGLWSQWLDHVGSFWEFELERWERARDAVYRVDAQLPSSVSGLDIAGETLNAWKPKEIEAEAWLGEPPEDYDRADPDYVNPDGPPVGDIPWMGKADVILDSASVPGVEGTGVVILDYKTGKTPDKRYRDEGIFLEGEYYGWLFEEFYDVDAVAGYYPQADQLIISPYPSQERRFDIKRAVLGMQKPPDLENFPAEEQPLCHYGHGKCFFYDQCESTWNE